MPVDARAKPEAIPESELPPVATPRTYLPFTARALWANLPMVILGGVALALLCTPAYLLIASGLFVPGILLALLTLLPGWMAVMAQAIALIREQPAGPGVLLRALGRFYTRGLLLGLLFCLPLAPSAIAVQLLGSAAPPGWVTPSLFANGSILAIMIAVSFYAVPLLVGHDQTLRQALRNGVLLAGRFAGNTVGLLAMGILLALATRYLSTGLVFFLPAIWAFFIASNALMAVREGLAQDRSDQSA